MNAGFSPLRCTHVPAIPLDRCEGISLPRNQENAHCSPAPFKPESV
jgi:hypothetical protein